LSMRDNLIYMNDKWINRDDARVSVFNPGFASAESVYETLRTYDGKIFKFFRHYERLINSATAMRFSVHKSNAELEDIIYEGMERNGIKEAYIRIQITSLPDTIVSVKALPERKHEIYEKGVPIGISPIKRNAYMYNGTAIKTTAALDVFISRLNKPPEYYDWLMMNTTGKIAEGSFSNVFLVNSGILMTPSLETGILSGITREVAIELAEKETFPVFEKTITSDELNTADEIFLTHTSRGIVPVSRLEKKELPVGPVTKTLMDALNRFAGS